LLRASRSASAGGLCAQGGDIRTVLRTIEEGLLSDQLLATEVVRINRSKLGIHARPPGFRKRQRAEVGKNVDTHGRYPQLHDELWIEQRLDRHVARRRTAEEVCEGLDEAPGIRLRRRYEQAQIFRRPRSSMESERVSPPMR
jgi:hypothetical protein